MDKGPTIGVLAPWYGGFYFGAMLSGIHPVVKKHNGRVVAVQTIARHLRRNEQPPYESELAWDLVDGWVIIVDAVNKNYIDEFKSKGKSVVLISPPADFNGYPVIVPDNFEGTAKSVQHLIDHGHTDIAFVGYFEHLDIKERLEGYKSALIERGIPVNEKLIFEAKDNATAGGSGAGIRMLRSRSPFTAVVTGTDLNAIGLIEVLRSGGLRVPEDVAVIGFDDLTISATLDPPLSSVRQRFDSIASTAAELLIDQIEGKDVPPIHYKVSTELILRNSCGCTGSLKTEQDVTRTIDYSDFDTRIYYENMVVNTYKIFKNLYITTVNGHEDLAWLAAGGVRWACLGLRLNKLETRTDLVIDRFFSVDGDPTPPLGEAMRVNEFPLQGDFPSAMTPGGDNIMVLLPLKTQAQDWGVLAISLPLETRPMTDNGVMEEWAEIITMLLENEPSQIELKNLSAKLAKAEQELIRTQHSLQDKNKLVGDFLDNIAGELRGLLLEINNDLEILTRESQNQNVFTSLTEISARTKTLFRLLSDIESLPRERSI